MSTVAPPLPPREKIRAAIARLRPGDFLALDVPLTVDEFYEVVEEDDAVELIDGVIYMPSTPTDDHEDLFGWLFVILRGYVGARGLGKVRGSRSAIRIGDRTARQPDMMFIANENVDGLQRLELDGIADFIVEIVDSARARREAVIKQAQYERLGVPELWIIDMPRRELRWFRLRGARYERVAVDPDGEVEPGAVPGLRLRVAWFFQGSDRPTCAGILLKLLGAVLPD